LVHCPVGGPGVREGLLTAAAGSVLDRLLKCLPMLLQAFVAIDSIIEFSQWLLKPATLLLPFPKDG
jgi:hypothetical protein